MSPVDYSTRSIATVARNETDDDDDEMMLILKNKKWAWIDAGEADLSASPP
jgi:hypothetical protein